MDQIKYFVAGSLIDGRGASLRRNVYLAVKNSIITAIGDAHDLPTGATTAIVDLAHCTIVPALVDCSVSLSTSPSVDPQVRLTAEAALPAEKAVMVTRHLGYCYSHGVLGVAEIGKSFSELQGVIESSEIDIRTSDHDFLRIAYSQNIEGENDPPPELSGAGLFNTLHSKGKAKAIVLANGPEQVAEALAGGCDAIEQGYNMGRDNLRKMADMDVLWIPSVLRAKNSLDASASGGDVACRFSTRYVAPGGSAPGAEAFWQKTLAEQLSQLNLARKLGVKTAVGTGAGSSGILHGESVVEEMKLFIKAGYTLEEALCSASKNGAEFFGMDSLGPLEVGNKATFLITRGTPQQLPRKLAYLEGMYVNGQPSRAYHK